MKQDSLRPLLWVVLFLVFFSAKTLGEDPAGKSACPRETLIRISTEKEGTATHLYVENVQNADVTVTFEMDLSNLSATVPFPYTTTLSGKTKTKLFTLTPINSGRGWSWTYTYYSTFGSTKVQHDDAYIYSLPYSPGRSYRVSQGYNGEYSHFGADQFAIDWRMPMNTPVNAARGGIVVGIKDDSNTGGDDSKYDWDANYILIQHSDGTLGQYVHLIKGGCRVKLGQRVDAGDWIGMSGNTGHSTGPHLHFSVFKAKDGKHRQTIPVRYKTAENLVVTLEEGKSYKASGLAVSSGLLAGSKLKSSPGDSKTLQPAAGAPASEPDPVLSQAGNAVGH